MAGIAAEPPRFQIRFSGVTCEAATAENRRAPGASNTHANRGTVTDELINEYINEQEGETVHEDDGRFQIDPS
jgi:hypothetical protein